jgi:hypothetical protein
MIIRTPTIDVNSQIEFPLNSYPIRKTQIEFIDVAEAGQMWQNTRVNIIT